MLIVIIKVILIVIVLLTWYTCVMILIDPPRTPMRMFWLCSAFIS